MASLNFFRQSEDQILGFEIDCLKVVVSVTDNEVVDGRLPKNGPHWRSLARELREAGKMATDLADAIDALAPLAPDAPSVDEAGEMRGVA
jgi:hypothetical protein